MRPFIPQNSKRDANPLGGNSATQEILLGIKNHHGSKHFGEFLPISWQFLVKNHSASRTFDLCWVSKALFCWIFPFFGARKGHFLKKLRNENWWVLATYRLRGTITTPLVVYHQLNQKQNTFPITHCFNSFLQGQNTALYWKIWLTIMILLEKSNQL